MDAQGLLYERRGNAFWPPRVSRLPRLLRADHLIEKMPRTHRYQVTRRGREIIGSLQTARRSNLNALLQDAT